MDMLIVSLIFFGALFAVSAFLLVRSLRKTAKTLKKMFRDEDTGEDNVYLEEWRALQPADEDAQKNAADNKDGTQEE
ncbi:MAG: hypothetical protein Q4G07_00145 [Oscillospiraceae bacterium]|nr:hypothetical protein [Oscillospiraceae bacterium]